MSFENREKAPELRILEEQETDKEKSRQVFEACWRITYPNKEVGITEDDIEHRLAERRSPEGQEKARQWREGPGKDEIRLVAKEGERVVGVCRFFRGDGKENELKALYVLPSEQGKQVGTKLWKEAHARMNPGENTILYVATYNDQAIGFYESLGFQKTDTVIEVESFRMKSGSNIPQMKMILLAQHDRS